MSERPSKRVEPGVSSGPSSGVRSAELSSNESADRTTQLLRLCNGFSLREDTDHRLSPRRPHEHTPVSVHLRVETLDLVNDVWREHSDIHPDVLLHLGVVRHHADHFGEWAPTKRRTEEQRRRQPVTGHVTVEPDDVTGLLAAQNPSFAAERLEHVAVADVGRDHTNAALG